ncbi:MAG: thiamine biosynthesis protein [Byssovorax sp.]
MALIGCSSNHLGPDPVPPPPLPSASASAAPSAALPRPSPRDTDPRWLRAREADPAEKARLADAEGATGLLEGVEDGGDNALTALSALPFAGDGELALRRLGELGLRPGALPRRAVLSAILGVSGQPRRQREALDPEGAIACGKAVIALAQRADLPREERALAVSAARALAELGYVDAAAIPGDLDPK